MANGKSRYFALVSYLSVEQLASLFQQKSTSIRAWVAIDHDKDNKEPHRHAVIRTHSTWTAAQVQAWFKGYFVEGKEVNTFVEVVHDRSAICDYLTHENNPDKYRYDRGDIIDHGLDDILPSGESSDDTFEIVEKMLAGVSTREMVRLYGRDFLYHYGSYALVVERIRQEESAW